MLQSKGCKFLLRASL